MPGLDINWFR